MYNKLPCKGINRRKKNNRDKNHKQKSQEKDRCRDKPTEINKTNPEKLRRVTKISW
jgi:hypothetical protein